MPSGPVLEGCSRGSRCPAGGWVAPWSSALHKEAPAKTDLPEAGVPSHGAEGRRSSPQGPRLDFPGLPASCTLAPQGHLARHGPCSPRSPLHLQRLSRSCASFQRETPKSCGDGCPHPRLPVSLPAAPPPCTGLRRPPGARADAFSVSFTLEPPLEAPASGR